MSEPLDQPDVRRVREAAARKGVALDIRVFETTTHTAADAASAIGVELGQIVKSLVFVRAVASGDLEGVVCLVSGSNRVDLGRLAAVTGRAEIRRATANEASELTGFSIGGIPPIAHRRPLRTVMDPALSRYPIVWAAAGTPSAVFAVSPAILRMLSNATVAPITEDAASTVALTLESSSSPVG